MSDPFKYAKGVSARPPGHKRPYTLLEYATLAHVGLLLVFATWALGGNTGWARTLLSWWGSFGVLITLSALRDPEAKRLGYRRPVRWLWPLVLFNVMVGLSSFNPSFREVHDGVNILFVEDRAKLALPSTARPLVSLQSLWFFDAAYLSCFNLALVIRQRRALRGLLLILAANAVVLAVLGTIQKLMGAKGQYFGAIKTPQAHFFSTFIYHNHWGAFTVLMLGVTLGLVFHFARRRESRDFWHSPAFTGLVAIVFMAATIPLSSSRSCTVLAVVLLAGALAHWFIRLIRQRRAFKESVLLPVAGAAAAIVLAGYFAYDLGRDVIHTRIEATRTQIADMQAEGEWFPREVLYRDTWHMAQEKIWFGWGMGSYPTAFFTRNSQHNPHADGLPEYFHDAHSDWLQSLSEVGVIGTTLLLLCAAVPLWYRRRVLGQSPLSAYLLAGCGIILLYSALEFPFGNRAVVIAFWVCFFCAIHYGRIDAATDAAA